MNLLGPQTRVWLVLGATDMRKAINGLSLMVADRLGHDAFSGHLFAFCNRGRTLIKILYWDRGGFVLVYKRLERGRFQMPRIADDATSVTLDAASLEMLMGGVDMATVKRIPAWKPASAA